MTAQGSPHARFSLTALALLAGLALLATLALSSCSEEKGKGDENRERADCFGPVRGGPAVELAFRVQVARSGSPAEDLLAKTETALCERQGWPVRSQPPSPG